MFEDKILNFQEKWRAEMLLKSAIKMTYLCEIDIYYAIELEMILILQQILFNERWNETEEWEWQETVCSAQVTHSS